MAVLGRGARSLEVIAIFALTRRERWVLAAVSRRVAVLFRPDALVPATLVHGACVRCWSGASRLGSQDQTQRQSHERDGLRDLARSLVPMLVRRRLRVGDHDGAFVASLLRRHMNTIALLLLSALRPEVPGNTSFSGDARGS